jgi:N-dimethylarginine dimethylaminohydrolase
MKEEERKNEHLGLDGIIGTLQSSDVILRPEDLFLEGGDIILDNKVLFVGISQRTDLRGLEWLKMNFSDSFEVTPIFLSPGFLHLDCVFNLISDEFALVLKRGITDESLQMINNRYKVISVHGAEQGYLPTNVFVIDHNNIVADPRCIKTNEMIRKIGKNVHEIKFSEISKIGGSFRCSTCPLIRMLLSGRWNCLMGTILCLDLSVGQQLKKMFPNHIL